MNNEDYPTIPDGEWTHVKASGFRHACCDCGLVHVMDFRVTEGKVEIRARRRKTATKVRRRKLGLVVYGGIDGSKG